MLATPSPEVERLRFARRRRAPFLLGYVAGFAFVCAAVALGLQGSVLAVLLVPAWFACVLGAVVLPSHFGRWVLAGLVVSSVVAGSVGVLVLVLRTLPVGPD